MGNRGECKRGSASARVKCYYIYPAPSYPHGSLTGVNPHYIPCPIPLAHYLITTLNRYPITPLTHHYITSLPRYPITPSLHDNTPNALAIELDNCHNFGNN